MNSVVWILAAFLVTVSAVLICQFVRLRKKEAQINELLGISSPVPSFSEEMTTAAIDQFLYDKCCRYMVEKRPFLVDRYSIQDLANALFTNRAYLSRVINQYSGKNFRSYVNYYRIMYAVELFRNNPSLRIVEMAQLSGFHSNTSFYQAFRAVMKEPPSHWCSRVRKETLKK